MTLVAISFDPEPVGNPDGLWIYAGLLFLSAGLAWIFYIMVIDTNVRADNEGIHYHSLLVPERSIEWSEIKAIRYSSFSQCIVVKGERVKIRIHPWMSNIYRLLTTLNEMVPEERIQKNMELLVKHLRLE